MFWYQVPGNVRESGAGYRVPGIREYKKIQEPGVRLLEPDFSITTTTTKSAAGGGPGTRHPEPESLGFKAARRTGNFFDKHFES
jgi:hypothetical protein